MAKRRLLSGHARNVALLTISPPNRSRRSHAKAQSRKGIHAKHSIHENSTGLSFGLPPSASFSALRFAPLREILFSCSQWFPDSRRSAGVVARYPSFRWPRVQAMRYAPIGGLNAPRHSPNLQPVNEMRVS